MATLTATVDGPAMSSTAEAVEKVGGIEEEWFLEGTASGFRLVGGATEYRTDGRWAAESSSQAHFRTRLLVVRPSDPARFNGTVIVNWNNVSAGESFEPPRSAARRVEDGFVVVGVSAQRIGVEGADGAGGTGFPMPALKTDDPERYGSLEHPGDDYSFDIFTQAAELLGPDRPREPDPLPGFEVRHVIATGGSQSGARLMTYVQRRAAARLLLRRLPVDGVPERSLRAQRGVGARVIASDERPEPLRPPGLSHLSAPRRPDHAGDRGQLRGRGRRLLPERPARQRSRPRLGDRGRRPCRHALRRRVRRARAIAGIPHSDVCFAPATRGAVHALHRWVNGGAPPPKQPRIQRRTDEAAYARDENGNALGGIRWPDLEAPLATHRGEPEPGGFPFSLGLSTPFPEEKVRALYPDHAAWFAKYKAAVEHLVDTEVILPDDAAEMLARAASADLPD